MGDKKNRNISKTPLAEQLNHISHSAFKRYINKATGDYGLTHLLKYEISMLLFGNVYGGIGYLLRKYFYRSLFKSFGSGIIIGKGMALRHPRKISLGNHVAIDDYTLIDASGAGNEGILLLDDIIISRNCVIQGKTGGVKIGRKTDIGCNTVITSGGGISIGNSVIIAANCYIGGGRYVTERIGVPIMEQGLYSEGPVTIGDGTWIGAGVIVLDGVSIGKCCVIGAGAVVTKNIPDHAVAMGIPAKIISRKSK